MPKEPTATAQQIDAISKFVKGVIGPNTVVLIFNPHNDAKAETLMLLAEAVHKEYEAIPQEKAYN